MRRALRRRSAWTLLVCGGALALATSTAWGALGVAAPGWNLSGRWVGSFGNVFDHLSQSGSSVTWKAHAGDGSWVQEFTGTLSGSDISGTFSQDAPGVEPQRYHGTITARVVDACHIRIVRVTQPGVADAGGEMFTLNGCSTKPAAAAPKAKVVSMAGDVEFSTDGGKTFSRLTPGIALRNGDYVTTGFRSSVKLDFGYDTLTVYQTTQFRIDTFTDRNTIAKTKGFLRVGSLRVKERHRNGIRSDFSVTTPTCNTSIRDTDTVVSVAKNGTTTVYAVKDVSYVKGLADTKTTTLQAGYLTRIGPDKNAQTPVPYTAAALKKITG